MIINCGRKKTKMSLQLGENSKICIESNLSVTIVGQSDSGFGCEKLGREVELCPDTGQCFPGIIYRFWGEMLSDITTKRAPKGQ